MVTAVRPSQHSEESLLMMKLVKAFVRKGIITFKLAIKMCNSNRNQGWERVSGYKTSTYQSQIPLTHS